MKNGLRAYISGFGLSLALTLTAYYLVARHVHSHHLIYRDSVLIAIIIVLALVQFFAQLIFFFHLGEETKPKWHQASFSFMAGVVLILVLGSLWIMHNLNYTMMNNQPTNEYIIKDEGFGQQH